MANLDLCDAIDNNLKQTFQAVDALVAAYRFLIGDITPAIWQELIYRGVNSVEAQLSNNHISTIQVSTAPVMDESKFLICNSDLKYLQPAIEIFLKSIPVSTHPGVVFRTDLTLTPDGKPSFNEKNFDCFMLKEFERVKSLLSYLRTK